MGKTVAEKILSAHSRKDAYAKDLVVADVDFIMGQDGTSPLAIKALRELGKKVLDPEKVALVVDHGAPSPEVGFSSLHKMMRKFSHKEKVKLYDIGAGICHQLVPEQGHVVPGDLVVGADSHTCTYGAIGAFSCGVGSTDLAIALASGKLWFRVPETIKFILKGKLAKGIYSKDLILYLIGDVGADGATYMAAEFVGEAIDNLSVEARFTITNMAVEMGAKSGLMLVDKKAQEWVKAHSARSFEPVFPDDDANYTDLREYNVSNLEPQVAKPHMVDNVSPLGKVEGTSISQAFLGTCTNGRLEDLTIAAEILKGKQVHPDVKFIVAPASRKIYLEAIRAGVIETFIEANSVVLTPGCGPCVGTHSGIPADGEVVISTANRNFKGRMGNPKASIYLASPATVAASAVEGKITDPRKYMR